MEIELPYKFTPRDYQYSVIRAVLDQGTKRAVCVWHRRAGKDKTFLNILVMKACETMGNYFPTAPSDAKPFGTTSMPDPGCGSSITCPGNSSRR